MCTLQISNIMNKWQNRQKQAGCLNNNNHDNASLTLAVSLCVPVVSVVSSCCVHTGGRAVCVARLLRVETVIPRSVAVAAAMWNYKTICHLSSKMFKRNSAAFWEMHIFDFFPRVRWEDWYQFSGALLATFPKQCCLSIKTNYNHTINCLHICSISLMSVR